MEFFRDTQIPMKAYIALFILFELFASPASVFLILANHQSAQADLSSNNSNLTATVLMSMSAPAFIGLALYGLLIHINNYTIVIVCSVKIWRHFRNLSKATRDQVEII